VAAKIANRCHAFSLTPCGAGINQIINAMAKVMITALTLISFIRLCFLMV
jgi:hypothetical protein